MSLLAKRDSDLAEKLINSTPESQTNTGQTSPTRKRGGEGKLYLTLANELIPTDPRRAANLIPKVFNSGFSIELVVALKFLGRKEPEAADNLLRRALSEIQPDPEAPMMDLFVIGQYFMADYEESAGHNDAGQKDQASAEPEPIKPVLLEPLLNFAFKAITIESANEQGRMSSGKQHERMVMFDMIDQGFVEWLLPFFEQHQPERAAFIRSHLGHIEYVIPTAVHQAMNAPRPTTVKELLDEAQTKKEPFQKDLFYAEAARKAEEAGDFDQAIAITEKLSDKRMGTDVSLIRNSASIKASDKGDIDAAYRFAITLPDPFDQARALCRIALKSFEKRDLQRANELINEAEKMIAKSGPTPEKVFALLDMSAAATTINPAGGFEFVNTAIAVINQIHSSKSQSSRMNYIRDSMTFEKSLGMLARADFERAMRLALAIIPSDVSVLAQLAVCRGALVGPKE